MWAAKNGARVIAIEPDLIALESMQGNVALNVYTTFQVVAGAISESTFLRRIFAHTSVLDSVIR